MSAELLQAKAQLTRQALRAVPLNGKYNGENALTTPLLSSHDTNPPTHLDNVVVKKKDDDGLLSIDEDEKTPQEKNSLVVFLKSFLAVVFAMGASAISISSMVAVGAPVTIGPFITYISSGLCSILSPVVAYRETTLAKMNSLRSVINCLRKDANRLTKINRELGVKVEQLEAGVEKINVCEERLHRIASIQGYDVSHCVGLVKTNAHTMEQMKKVVVSETLQDIIRLVIKSDLNRDFMIDEEDLSILIIKLRAQGLEMNWDHFQTNVRKDRSLAAVLKNVRPLLMGEEHPEDAITFTILRNRKSLALCEGKLRLSQAKEDKHSLLE